jgi:hypothetical protein
MPTLLHLLKKPEQKHGVRSATKAVRRTAVTSRTQTS